MGDHIANEGPSGKAGGEIIPLTGLRGIAAFYVLLAHINMFLSKQFDDVPKLLYAQPYVDLFFILSGFVISYVYFSQARLQDFKFGKFVFARFARIYPIYIGAAVIFAVYEIMRYGLLEKIWPANITFSSMFSEVFLLSALPIVGGHQPSVFTAWSISIEWWVYLMASPILLLFFKARPALIPLWTVAAVYLLLAAVLYLLPDTVKDTRSWPALARGIVGFFAGAILFQHFEQKTEGLKRSVKWNTALAVFIGFTALAVPMVFPGQPWFILPFLPFLVLGLSVPQNAVCRFLSRKSLHFIGLISYSVYILHPFVLTVVIGVLKLAKIKDDMVFVSIFTILSVVVTIMLSALSYYFWENPSRQWINRIFNRKSKETKLASGQVLQG